MNVKKAQLEKFALYIYECYIVQLFYFQWTITEAAFYPPVVYAMFDTL